MGHYEGPGLMPFAGVGPGLHASTGTFHREKVVAVPVKKIISRILLGDKTPTDAVQSQITSAVLWTCVLVLLKLH